MGDTPFSAARALAPVGRVKRRLKAMLARAAAVSGLLGVYRRRPGRDVILLYHRVLTSPDELVDYSPIGISVSLAAFERQMAYLARHYDVVPLATLAATAAAGSGHGGKPRCAITFDDGWLDNLTAAWPVLQRHAFPATIFLATNLMEGGAWFWEERIMAYTAHCHQLLLRGGVPADALRAHVRDDLLLAVMSGPAATLPAAIATYVGGLRKDPVRRDAATATLDAAVRLPGCEPGRWFMTWDEVRGLANKGMDFGGHTASHVALSGCPLEQAADEIRRSSEALTSHLGRRERSFAYPYGKFTPAVARAVADAGFARACTTRRGPVAVDSQPFDLPRIDVYEDVALSLPMFGCRITQFFGLF